MLGCNRIKFAPFLCLVLTYLLTSCTSMQVNHSGRFKLDSYQKTVVLPFNNMTETPQADERAASMTADLLRNKGLRYVTLYQPKSTRTSVIPGLKAPLSRDKLLYLARQHHAEYAMTGGVTEWNYKVGLDGEPAVGLNLELIHVESGQVVWNAVGSRSGGSRTALSDVGMTLLERMLNSLKVARANG